MRTASLLATFVVATVCMLLVCRALGMSGLIGVGTSLAAGIVAGVVMVCLLIPSTLIPTSLDTIAALFSSLAEPIGRGETVEATRMTAHRRLSNCTSDCARRLTLCGFVLSHFALTVSWYGGYFRERWFASPPINTPPPAIEDDTPPSTFEDDIGE